MTSEGGSGYLVLVHEVSDAVWNRRVDTGYVLPPEVLGVVGVYEVSRVEDVDVALVDDLGGL